MWVRIIFAFLLLTPACESAFGELKLLYEEDASLLTTSIHVVVLTGSADDPLNKTGLTNLLGELMLRGTKKRNRSKFQTELERLGGVLSVRTSHETTNFEGRVIKENTAAFIKLLEECLLLPAFDKTEFSSLKQEQLAEIQHRKNQNARLAGLAVRREIFAGTPLERPSDGSFSTISKIQLDDLQRTYNDQFHRGNILFLVSSPFKEAELKKALSPLWEKLVDGARRERKPASLKLPSKPTLLVVNKPNTATGSILFGTQGIVAQEPERWNLMTGNFSFGGEQLVSRLFRVIRGELGWTYSIVSTYHAMGALSYQSTLYGISTTPSIEYAGKTILKSLAMWKDYVENGLKSEEILLAQDSQVNAYPFEFESAEKRLGLRGYAAINNLPILSPEDYEKKIRSVGNTSLKQALKKIHSTNQWVIALVADKNQIEKQLETEQASIPESERLRISKVLSPDQVIE